MQPPAASTLQAANLPPALRSELLPALELLVERHHPEGLWLFGSWARGSASRRSDVDLLVMGLSDKRLLDAYDAVLEALQDCRLPIQPLLAHGEGGGDPAAGGMFVPISYQWRIGDSNP